MNLKTTKDRLVSLLKDKSSGIQPEFQNQLSEIIKRIEELLRDNHGECEIPDELIKEIGEVQQCPHCGFHADTMQMAPYLAVRTVVANRYLIGKLLEYNGDGATYIAWDINEKKPVTIREFLPDTLATRRVGEKEVSVLSGCELSYRECMADFVELWRKLTRMSGLSALVNVFDVFEENSTAYAICEYVKSITLRDYLLRLKTGYIPWERARALFMPVLSTLGMLHTAGIIHRGISPLTLHIGQDGKMRIGGFSIWQARTAKSDLSAQLFPGYAAIEQYGYEGKQGPGTDIYAFAATLYRALIGSDPIEATERLTNDRLMVPGRFAEQLPAYVINGLINALQIMPEERTRSVEQLRADLPENFTLTGCGANSASSKAVMSASACLLTEMVSASSFSYLVFILSRVSCSAVVRPALLSRFRILPASSDISRM